MHEMKDSGLQEDVGKRPGGGLGLAGESRAQESRTGSPGSWELKMREGKGPDIEVKGCGREGCVEGSRDMEGRRACKIHFAVLPQAKL